MSGNLLVKLVFLKTLNKETEDLDKLILKSKFIRSCSKFPVENVGTIYDSNG